MTKYNIVETEVVVEVEVEVEVVVEVGVGGQIVVVHRR